MYSRNVQMNRLKSVHLNRFIAIFAALLFAVSAYAVISAADTSDAEGSDLLVAEANREADEALVLGCITNGSILRMSDSTGMVELTSETVSNITSERTGSIKFTISDAQKDDLGAKRVVKEKIDRLFSIDLSVGSESVHQLGNNVKVTLDYDLPEGKDVSDMYVGYIADDGSVQRIECLYSEGKLSFETDHFSNYAVMFDEETTSHMMEIAAAVIILAAVAIIVVGYDFRRLFKA